MTKDYQTDELDAPIPLQESVSVAMEDIATTMREGLLAMAVGAGLSVMETLMDESVSRMLAKLSTRRYRTGLEPVGEAVENRHQTSAADHGGEGELHGGPLAHEPGDDLGAAGLLFEAPLR